MKPSNGIPVALALMVLAIGCENNNDTSGITGIPPKNAAEPAPAVESTESFSYTPPAGWLMFSAPGMKYRTAIGPLVAGALAPSMSVAEEAFKGSLADYATQKIATLREMFKAAKVLKEDEFKTSTGAECRRAVVENLQNPTPLRQSMYFFGKGDKKFVVTCTTYAQEGEKLDPVFEASMATFRVAGE